MRDDIGILNRTPVLEPRVNGLPTPMKDSAHAGFTAVNTGDAPSAATFRHDSAGSRPITLPPVNHNPDINGEHATMTRVAAYNAHSWRPIDEPLSTTREDPTKDSNPSKRKRADSPADASSNNEHVEHLDRSRVESPKRRQMDEHHDDVSSRPGREDHQQPIELSTDPDHRQVTPDQPAPAPRPDAGDKVQYVTSQPQGRPSSSSGPDTDQTRQASFPRGSENPHGVDDKNKRKRNFSNRTKTGCHTCRTRKKKCDEGRPRCQNCIRGSFECGGYGPKPLGGPKAALKRAEIPLQAKQNEAYPRVNGQQYGYERSPYVEHPSQPGPTPIERYNLPQPRVHESHPSRHPPPHFQMDTRLPPGPESWQNRGHVPYDDRRELPPAPHYHPPEVALPAPPPHMYPASLPPPPPPPPRGYYEPSYPPPSHMYRPGTATAHTVISSRESVVSSASGSYHSGLPSYLQHSSAPVTARSKMLRGERYTHFQDTALRNERISCRKAVEAYNDSCKAVNPSSSHEQERNFLAIYEPRERAWEHGKAWDGPSGSVGSHAVVETPFNCEFGYNIHLGKDVLIQQNCTLQDASIIYIGDRSIIGPNVKFYCITTSVDAEQRRGSRGDFQAGPIRVEEDVYIGADSIILPFRTIGKGAVVGAGSVVTRDVKPHTVVAGNPAKPIRKRKIESGPNADRHSDEIEEQNQEMLRKLQNNEVIPRDD